MNPQNKHVFLKGEEKRREGGYILSACWPGKWMLLLCNSAAAHSICCFHSVFYDLISYPYS